MDVDFSDSPISLKKDVSNYAPVDAKRRFAK
jgi:hypothetical protein